MQEKVLRSNPMIAFSQKFGKNSEMFILRILFWIQENAESFSDLTRGRIEEIAEWDGTPGELFAALFDCGLFHPNLNYEIESCINNNNNNNKINNQDHNQSDPNLINLDERRKKKSSPDHANLGGFLDFCQGACGFGLNREDGIKRIGAIQAEIGDDELFRRALEITMANDRFRVTDRQRPFGAVGSYLKGIVRNIRRAEHQKGKQADQADQEAPLSNPPAKQAQNQAPIPVARKRESEIKTKPNPKDHPWYRPDDQVPVWQEWEEWFNWVEEDRKGKPPLPKNHPVPEYCSNGDTEQRLREMVRWEKVDLDKVYSDLTQEERDSFPYQVNVPTDGDYNLHRVEIDVFRRECGEEALALFEELTYYCDRKETYFGRGDEVLRELVRLYKKKGWQGMEHFIRLEISKIYELRIMKERKRNFYEAIRQSKCVAGAGGSAN